MCNDPLIGILVNRAKPIEELKQAANLNVRLFLFRPKDINWEEKMIKGLLLKNDHFESKNLPFPESVYVRCYTASKTLSKQLEKIIGKGKVFNCVTRFDKWKVYQILKKSAVRHFLPDTQRYSQQDFLECLNRYRTILVKPRKSDLGKGIYRIEKIAHHGFNIYDYTVKPAYSPTNEKELLEKLDELTSEKKRFILQEFIHADRIDDRIYDIRILVQKNGFGQWETSGGFGRVSNKMVYKTNYAAELMTLDNLVHADNRLTHTRLSMIKSIAISAARVLEKGYGHLGDISVDFYLDIRGRPWILEANGKTQKKTVKLLDDEQLIKNTYLKPIEYARFLAQ